VTQPSLMACLWDTALQSRRACLISRMPFCVLSSWFGVAVIAIVFARVGARVTVTVCVSVKMPLASACLFGPIFAFVLSSLIYLFLLREPLWALCIQSCRSQHSCVHIRSRSRGLVQDARKHIATNACKTQRERERERERERADGADTARAHALTKVRTAANKEARPR
jgi:hypothetical protein